ncbi:DUF445 domain-containing protein [Algicola sagamiensis]|uniref:DUF445 domain-containing protein n=1 Tax=Algicola sagamiensis TaxID=163869 RepID=UPI000380646A|nr:DUF445 family protein [Algicola sagamiensis]
MDWILEHLILMLIPIISAFVGWLTNYLAVKMMFYPVRFVGIKPIFGWQGLIPAKAREMAEIETDLILNRLLSVEDIAKRIDAKQLTENIERRLNQVLKGIINTVMKDSAPQLWAMMPIQGKKAVYHRVEMDVPDVVNKMVQDFQDNVVEILNIKELVIEQLTKNPGLVNEIFIKSGEKEFPFIERSGFYFGFLFGIPTMVLWYFYQAWWLLPLGGLIVGYATNWIAIQIIFEPKRPKKLGPITIQGMFLKRQNEVSTIYSDIIEKKLINAENIVDTLLRGQGSDQLFEIIELHVNEAIDRYLNVTQPYVVLTIGSENYYTIKDNACKMLFEHAEKYLLYAYDYANDALNIGNDLRQKMQALEPEEFEGVLRPAYKQDEWKLIVVGAILGMCAGFMQLQLIYL